MVARARRASAGSALWVGSRIGIVVHPCFPVRVGSPILVIGGVGIIMLVQIIVPECAKQPVPLLVSVEIIFHIYRHHDTLFIFLFSTLQTLGSRRKERNESIGHLLNHQSDLSDVLVVFGTLQH